MHAAALRLLQDREAAAGDASAAVLSLTKRDLEEVQKLVTPPRSVQRTLTLVQAVLCSRPGDAEADWARISGPLKRDLRGLVAAFPETRL